MVSFHNKKCVFSNIQIIISYILVIICTGCSGYLYENTTNKYLTIDNGYSIKNFRTHRGAAREPRFISFETKDNSIEVEMSFNIPFITIPIKKSINGAQDIAAALANGTPLANINLGAIALAAVLALGGVWLGGISKVFQGGFFAFGPERNFNNQQRQDEIHQGTIQKVLNILDTSLQKYDIDTTACTQRIVCWFVKNAAINVSERKATTSEKIINGVTGSSWAMELTAGTAISDAIKAGKRMKNCEHTYSLCKLSTKHMKELANKFIREQTKT